MANFFFPNVLGINERTLRYVLPKNKKIGRVIDSKILTKEVLEEAGLPVLDTYFTIKTLHEFRIFNWDTLPNSFVLKPDHGYGGGGIIVLYARSKKSKEPAWIQAGGNILTLDELKSKTLNILEGMHSLFFLPDIVLFEERTRLAKVFKPYSFKGGIPDIRIIVCNNVPVMAMLRLPTKESQGKANLHQGALGCGIDMATGLTTNAIFHNQIIDYLPGTRFLLRGIKIPEWTKILETSAKAADAVGVRFLGVDIAIDKEKGPVIVELNRRPGLSIQIANLSSLKEKLERLKGLKVTSIKKAVRLAQDLFGETEKVGDLPEEKKILGVNEKVKIIEGDKEVEVVAKIDTGAFRTSISADLAQKLQLFDKVIGVKQVRSALGETERPIAPLKFILRQEEINTEVSIAQRSNLRYEMIIGRRDIKGFLVDPEKVI